MSQYKDSLLQTTLNFLSSLTPSTEECNYILENPDKTFKDPKTDTLKHYLQKPYNFLLFDRTHKKFTLLTVKTYQLHSPSNQLLIRDTEITTYIALGTNQCNSSCNLDFKGYYILFFIQDSLIPLLGGLLEA
jgi:hypothetical protein